MALLSITAQMRQGPQGLNLQQPVRGEPGRQRRQLALITAPGLDAALMDGLAHLRAAAVLTARVLPRCRCNRLPIQPAEVQDAPGLAADRASVLHRRPRARIPAWRPAMRIRRDARRSSRRSLLRITVGTGIREQLFQVGKAGVHRIAAHADHFACGNAAG